MSQMIKGEENEKSSLLGTTKTLINTHPSFTRMFNETANDMFLCFWHRTAKPLTSMAIFMQSSSSTPMGGDAAVLFAVHTLWIFGSLIVHDDGFRSRFVRVALL
jgi:hypothetical protein